MESVLSFLGRKPQVFCAAFNVPNGVPVFLPPHAFPVLCSVVGIPETLSTNALGPGNDGRLLDAHLAIILQILQE